MRRIKNPNIYTYLHIKQKPRGGPVSPWRVWTGRSSGIEKTLEFVTFGAFWAPQRLVVPGLSSGKLGISALGWVLRPFWGAPRDPLGDAWGKFLELLGVRWRPLVVSSSCRGRSCVVFWPGRRARSVFWGTFASFVLAPLFAQQTSESSCQNFSPGAVPTTSFPLIASGTRRYFGRPQSDPFGNPKPR